VAALLCAAVVPPAFAGKEQRVRFKPGEKSATVAGRLPTAEAEYDAYVLGARKGQTLSFTLSADDDKAYVVVYALELGPGEDLLTPASPEGAPEALREWSGELPVTGDYSVQVYSRGRGGPYRLEMGVE
jgi:hypothetical protein